MLDSLDYIAFWRNSKRGQSRWRLFKISSSLPTNQLHLLRGYSWSLFVDAAVVMSEYSQWELRESHVCVRLLHCSPLWSGRVKIGGVRSNQGPRLRCSCFSLLSLVLVLASSQRQATSIKLYTTFTAFPSLPPFGYLFFKI